MPQTPLSLNSLPFSPRTGRRFDSEACSQLQHPEPLTDSTLQLHPRDFLQPGGPHQTVQPYPANTATASPASARPAPKLLAAGDCK